MNVSLKTKLFSKKFTAILCTTLITGSAFAADLYVSTTGNDANTGSASAPFRSIQKAANVAQAGTVVHVAAGSYAGGITSSASGTASARIRYVSDIKWGAKITPLAGSANVWKQDGGYVDIEGFQVDGAGGTSTRVGIYLTGGNSSVKNSWIHHVALSSGCDSAGGAGLLADQYRGLTFNNYDFIGNVVHDIGGGCAWIQGIYHASSGNIKNNLVYATTYGIHLYHDDDNVNIVNNTVFGNSAYGVAYGGCVESYNATCPTSGIKIYNNIIYDNGGGIQGPTAAEDMNNVLKNNLVFGNRTNFDIASPSNATRSGEVSADPQFVNYIRGGGGDYRLKSTSPAIGMGSSEYITSVDLDGKSRLIGAAPDLGAYEYAPPVVVSPTLLTTTSSVLVSSPTTAPASSTVPVIKLSATQVAAGGIITVTVTGAGTSVKEWIALYASGTADSAYSYKSNWMYMNGSQTTPPAAPLASATLQFKAPMEAGTYNIRLFGADEFNHRLALSADIKVFAVAASDLIVPTVMLSSPTSGSIVSRGSRVRAVAVASDNVGITKVEFYINGVLKCTDTSASYTCSFPVSYRTNVSYTIFAKAYDAAGNTKFSSSVSIKTK